MINQRDWLATRRKLLESVKAEVRLRLGEPALELDRYARAIERDYRGPWRASDLNHLVRACTRARVVLGADFHAYAQSQRAHLRLLRDHVTERPVTLALECVRAEFDPVITQFLAGRISEASFLDRVRWRETWGFPWANYRPFFDLARARGYRVVGLNSGDRGDLRARDRWTAQRLARLVADDPALIFAVIGEWHVARTHVPRQIGLKTSELVTILQDVEPLYLTRAERTGSQVEILRAPRNLFCQFVSPPWMKWQSYLMFLEAAYDREIGGEAEVDHTDFVAGLVRVLASDLKVKVSSGRLQVFCPDSRASLARLKMSLPKMLARPLVYHLEHDLSFLLPERDWLYLSRASTNFSAALAGQFLHAQLCGRTRAAWNFPDDFQMLIWLEAIGFFFSKWINPERQPDALESVRLRLEARHPRDHGRKILELVLDQRMSEVIFAKTARVRPRRLKPRAPGVYIEAARVLGSVLGERLFASLRDGEIDQDQLMKYLRVNPEASEFANFYQALARRLNRGDLK